MRRVVVTGIGVVSAIGTGVEKFFDGLRQARPGIDIIKKFDASAFRTQIAGEVSDLVIDTVSLPDERRPALIRDPKSVFGLVAAREAVHDAFGTMMPADCYARSRLGVVVAAGLEVFHLDDFAPHVAGSSIVARTLLDALSAAPPLSRFQIPSDLGAECIRNELNAEGRFSVNLSACAAGTQALGEAFLAVRDGAVDAVVSGGYDSMVNPLGVGGFTLLGARAGGSALSMSNHLRGGASRPFDKCRDGFVLGEGAGMCILEEYEAAKRRRARIYAEVLGYASRLDAYHVSDPRPDHSGAVASMQAALNGARLRPTDVDYINAHGTGTPKNDPAETAAIHSVFKEHSRKLAVSSTKSQIGHLIGAAGAVEFVATLFAIKEGVLPATINLKEPDPQCDLDYVPLSPRPAQTRIAMSNSFGFGGQNATIVVGSLRI